MVPSCVCGGSWWSSSSYGTVERGTDSTPQICCQIQQITPPDEVCHMRFCDVLGKRLVPRPQRITDTLKLDILVELNELYQIWSKLTLAARFDESPDRKYAKNRAAHMCKHNTNLFSICRHLNQVPVMAQSMQEDVGKKFLCCR